MDRQTELMCFKRPELLPGEPFSIHQARLCRSALWDFLSVVISLKAGQNVLNCPLVAVTEPLVGPRGGLTGSAFPRAGIGGPSAPTPQVAGA